jgi:hypothetical protein
VAPAAAPRLVLGAWRRVEEGAILTAPERERLRKEIDRRRRERIGRYARQDDWVTIAEASHLLARRSKELRPLVRQLEIETKKRAGTTTIRVTDLDLLRD